MREMLDREMPVKPRRILGWWWVSLLMLPLAVYGGWQWIGANQVTPEKKEANTEAPTARVLTETNRSNSLPTAQNPDDPTQKSLPITVEKSVLQADQDHGTFSKVKKRVVKARSQGTTAEKTKPGQTIALSPIKTIFSEDLSPSKVQMATPQLPLDLCYYKPKTVEYQGHSESIPGIVFKQANLNPAKKTIRKHWVFGATSAASTEQFNTINGFSTGLTLDWNFARKWGLRTGLLYNIHSPQEKYRPVASIQSNDYSTKVDGNVIFVDVNTGQEVFNTANNQAYTDSLSGNVFIPVNRLQRLELPITAFWQATSVLKVLGGLTLNRTFSTKADRQNFSSGYILQLADQTAADDASKLSSKELGNWSADAMLGIGFSLGRSFELGLAAKMPMNKISGYSTTSNPTAIPSLDNLSVSATRKISSPVFTLYGTLFF